MLAGSSGTTASRRPAAITMPPECWPRWRGRFRRPRAASQMQAIAVLGRRKAGRRQVALQRPVVRRQPHRQVARDAIELLLRQAERAPRVAHRHARPVGDHVGGHGGAARAVLLVDVLDHQLALIARRQIQIDVGHAIGRVVGGGDALLGQKAFEQQIHPHRIDGGDAEDVSRPRSSRPSRAPAP